MSRALGALVGIALVVALGVFVARRPVKDKPGAVPSGPPAAAERKPAPDFTRTALDGSSVSLADFRGKQSVLVNSWAAWCPFCVRELADFATLAEEFADDLVILAVDRGEPVSTQREFLRNVEGRDLLASRIRFLEDSTDEVYRLLGGYGMPVTLFVNRRGEVVSSKNGPLTLEEMRVRVRELLATDRE